MLRRRPRGEARGIAAVRAVVRLPPAVAIADSEEKLSKPGATYPLPPFYKRLFNGMDPVIPEAEKFKVHAERIGDYTISFCA